MIKFPDIIESKPVLFCRSCGASKTGWFVAIGIGDQFCLDCFRNLLRLALRHPQFADALLNPLLNGLAEQIQSDLAAALGGLAHREAARVVNIVARELLGEPEVTQRYGFAEA